MANYRRRLERDLDAWVAAGLVPAASRAPILASVGEARRLDAATALAVIGGLLAGVAVIAFVAANWGEIPRLVRFAIILVAFLGTALGAAWASGRERPILKDVLLAVATLIFAAAIGLTGQIFDIAGDPVTALHMAGLAGLALALAGRSPWAAVAGLLLLAMGDATGLGGRHEGFGWLLVAAPLSVVLALAWRSAALAHAAGLAMLVAVIGLPGEFGAAWQVRFLGSAAVFALLAAGARQLRPRLADFATVLYGWFVWAALIWFGAAGLGADPLHLGVAHSIAWLALSVAVTALGRHDAHGLVTAAGVLSLFAAGASLLFDLGVGLMTAAGVFAASAVAALVVALLLKRMRAA